MSTKNYLRLFVVLIMIFLFGHLMAMRFVDNDYVNLQVKNIPVRSALEMLAQYQGKQMVISPEIKGVISLDLHEKWEDALQYILKSRKLTMRESNNILFISEQVHADSVRLATAQYATTVLFLKYAQAEEVAKLLQATLLGQGLVSADVRTNSLLIQAPSQVIMQVKKTIQAIDIPVKQVMIAARIVNLDSDYEKELGVRFGAIITNGKLPKANNDAHSDPLTHLNVDLPVANQNPGQVGLALIKLNQGTLIDLELSALQSEGHADIISKPELVAANHEPAVIEAGQEIPYQEQTSSGATSVTFKKAVLSLKVTPQIIPGGKILLRLQVNQDNRNSKEVLGVPTIDTREMLTQVLVDNQQTIALGGIDEEVNTNHMERVPFFSSLPVLGNLFKYRKITHEKRELMIFVTPTICA